MHPGGGAAQNAQRTAISLVVRCPFRPKYTGLEPQVPVQRAPVPEEEGGGGG